MITKEEFEKYCSKNNLRYEFKNKYYQEEHLKSDWNCNNLFIVLCCYGYIETLKWLLSLEEINIHINNEEAFRESCNNGQQNDLQSKSFCFQNHLARSAK